MHRCLFISEIASLICFHGFEGWAGKRSIIAFAQTCRACYEPAVNVIWNDIPNLRPLLGLLPKQMWEKVDRRRYSDAQILNTLQLANWSRFEEHARRVRKYGVQYGQPRDIESDQYYALLLLGEHRGQPLLPNVEKLYISSLDPYVLTSLPLVTTKKLRLFHCVPTYGDSLNGLSTFLELCNDLGVRYPRLEKLVIDLTKFKKYLDVPSGLASAVYSGKWASLAHVDVNPATNVIFKRLPNLPALESLKIMMSEFPDTTPAGRSKALLKKPERLYPALRNLDVSCETLSTIMEYLYSLPDNTRVKTASFVCRDPAEYGHWMTLCSTCEERFDHTSLEQLYINDKTGERNLPTETSFVLPFERLSALRSFNYLTRVKIQTQGILDLDDSNFQSLASSWPRLEFLMLVGETPPPEDSHLKITLSSLIFIAENCPDLESLYLLFDARHVPVFPPGDPPTAGKKLYHLNVVDSPLPEKYPEMQMASFMFALFPNLKTIATGHQMRVSDPQRELKLMKMWRSVEVGMFELAYRSRR